MGLGLSWAAAETRLGAQGVSLCQQPGFYHLKHTQRSKKKRSKDEIKLLLGLKKSKPTNKQQQQLKKEFLLRGNISVKQIFRKKMISLVILLLGCRLGWENVLMPELSQQEVGCDFPMLPVQSCTPPNGQCPALP